MQRDHDEDESQQRSARADQPDTEVVPSARGVSRIHLRNMSHPSYRGSFPNTGPGQRLWTARIGLFASKPTFWLSATSVFPQRLAPAFSRPGTSSWKGAP